MHHSFAASDIGDRAEQALASVIADTGYQLLMCIWTGTGGRPSLQVYIERSDGESVGIGDCVSVHHAITDFLDVEDFIPVAYDLQVSSPGLERPLKRPAHFSEQIGELVRIRTWEPIVERRNWKGTIEAVDGDVVTLQVDGQDHRIPIPAIERASLVYVPPKKGQKQGGSSRRKRNSHR